jgi:hypothetical protein
MTTTDSSGYGATFPTDTASQSGSQSSTSDTSTTDVAKEQAGQVASSAKDQAAQVAGSAKESAAQVASTAKDSATQVASTASEKAGQVAQTTKEQAQEVVAEATTQARALAGELKTQASEQAGVQRDRIVEQLHSVGDELRQMVDNGGQSGVATELAGELATRVKDAASYLDGKEPADLLVAVKDYARRKPGTFLIGAAVAGLVAGRLTRGARAATSDDDSVSPSYAPSVPASTYAPTIPSSTYPTTMSSAAGFSSTYDEPATGYVGGTVLDDTTTAYDDPYGNPSTQGQRL